MTERIGTGWLSAALASLCVMGTATTASAQTDSLTVVTDAGAVHGASTASGRSFLGIPYAAPPVGALRWQPPAPVASWSTTRDATHFGSTCPQLASPFGLASTNEDCLFLNVYTPPAGGLSGLLPAPVLVYIHGGAFRYGEGSDYDPSMFVQRGMVVVTINYRIGALGFMAHPGLTAESPNHASGDYGLMDQQAALKWVQRNIARFGGDPNNVTIAGESAGGASVHSQVVSPGAAGLFKAGIVQSGAYVTANPSLATAESQGTALATSLGCSDVACLRAVPTATLLAKENPGPAGYLPNVDGKVLPQTIAAAFSSGNFNRVPIIEGSNHDEYRLFVALFLDLQTGPLPAAAYPAALASTFGLPSAAVTAVMQQYPLSNYASPDLALAAVGTDAVFACPAVQVDNWISQYVPTYAYEFNDPNAPELFLPPVSFPYAASHTSELQYLFGVRANVSAPALNLGQRALSTAMVSYWSQFARIRNPNGLGVPWAPYVSALGGAMQDLVPVTPLPSSVLLFANDHKCTFWAQLASQAS